MSAKWWVVTAIGCIAVIVSMVAQNIVLFAIGLCAIMLPINLTGR